MRHHFIHSYLRQTRGFSLIQIVVVLALSVVAMYAIQQGIVANTKAQLRLEARNDLMAVRQSLAMKLDCSKTLAAITDPATQCTATNYLVLKDKNGNPITEPLVTSGDLTGSGRFSDFYVRALCRNDDAKLELRFARGNPSTGFSKEPGTSIVQNFESKKPLLGYDGGKGACEGGGNRSLASNYATQDAPFSVGNTGATTTQNFIIPTGKKLELLLVDGPTFPLTSDCRLNDIPLWKAGEGSAKLGDFAIPSGTYTLTGANCTLWGNLWNEDEGPSLVGTLIGKVAVDYNDWTYTVPSGKKLIVLYAVITLGAWYENGTYTIKRPFHGRQYQMVRGKVVLGPGVYYIYNSSFTTSYFAGLLIDQ